MNIGIQKYTVVLLLLIVVVLSFFLYGENSSVQAITVPTPILLSPANQSNPVILDNGAILLDWNTVNVSGLGAAEKYEVEVIKEPTIESYNDGGVTLYRKKGSAQQFDFTVTSSVSQLVLSSSNLGKNISHGDIYRWRVRACSLNCIFNERGPWSEQRTFITKFKDPVLTEPLDGRLVLFSPKNPLTFTWGEVASAEQYELNLVDTATGVNAITPRSTSQKEIGLDFSTFAYLIQKTFNWTIEPFVLGEREEFFVALQNLFPGDNIPSKSISAPENFIVRLMPPNAPIFPAHEAEISQTSSIELKWDPILKDSLNTTYQVKKSDGNEVSEVFVPSNINILSVSSGELCELSTWEVRSCNENGTNCGPYPSHLSVQDAYPLDIVELGPWEFTVVPEFSGSDLKVVPYFDEEGNQGERGDVKITAIIETSNSTVVINFGDGTSEQVTLSENKFEVRHTYSRSKSYLISIFVEGGCNAPYEENINIDIDPPRVRSFNVSPESPDWVNADNPNVEISWNVTDSGGSYLDKVEVWRTINITSGPDPGNWNEIGDDITAGLESNSWNCSGSCPTDLPADGTYWYGIHVFDVFGNMVTEGTKGPIKVQVDKTPPPAPSIDLHPDSDSGFSNEDNITNNTTLTIIGTKEEGGSIKIYRKYLAEKKLVEQKRFIADEWGITLLVDGLDGEYVYTAKVVDDAGNESDFQEELIVIIDTKASQCEIIPSFVSKRISFLQKFKAINVNNDIVTYLWNGKSIDNNSSEFDKYYDQVINEEIKLEVFDAAGNSESCTAEVRALPSSTEPGTPVGDFPVITGIEPGSIAVKTGERIVFQASWEFAEEVSLKVCDSDDCSGKIFCRTGFSKRTPPVQCEYKVSENDSGYNRYYIFVCGDSRCSIPWSSGFEVRDAPSVPYDPSPGVPPDDGTQPGDVVSATPGACSEYCSLLGTDDAILPPDGTTCICNPLSSIKFSDIFNRIVNFLLNAALVVAPIALVASGFMFITAGGNPEQIIRARSIIIWTIVGVVVILLSKGLMNVLGGIIGI